MKNCLLLYLFIFLICKELPAQQQSFLYNFNSSLNEVYGKGSPLKPIEGTGNFESEYLDEVAFLHKVYKFNSNSGLTFTLPGVLILKGSYTIETYFKLEQYNSWKRVIDFKNEKSDTGPYIYFRKISFYRTEANDIPSLKAGEYLHYTITRDSASKEVTIYIDGISRIKFTDIEDQAVVSTDNRLNFFHDNLSMGNEASSGAVAYIKFKNYIEKPEEVKKNFIDLAKNLKEIGKLVPLETSPKPLVENYSKPSVEVVFRGKVFNSKNQAAVEAKMRLEFANGGKMEGAGNTNYATGFFLLKLMPGKKYVYYVTSDGFLDFSDTLDLTDVTASKEIYKEIYLDPLAIGQTLKLSHISFEQSKYDLLPSSFNELDMLVNMLKKNPTMEIELSGHTDNVGNPKLNLQLSENRVKAVRSYLVGKGIDAKRIKGRGYGGSKPVASNAKEETRKLNRRVEFVILKY